MRDAGIDPSNASCCFGAQSEVLYCILVILELAKGLNFSAAKRSRG